MQIKDPTNQATPTAPAEGESEGGQHRPDKLLRIGQLAELCNKTTRALHLYEELGLLKPVIRSRGGFRLYSQTAIERQSRSRQGGLRMQHEVQSRHPVAIL